MYIRASSAHGLEIYHGNSSPVFIGFNSASVTVKSSAQPPDFAVLECQNSKTLLIFLCHHLLTSVTFRVKCYLGSFKSSYGLCILELHLGVWSILGLGKRKVPRMTESLTIWEIVLRALDWYFHWNSSQMYTIPTLNSKSQTLSQLVVVLVLHNSMHHYAWPWPPTSLGCPLP